VDRSGIEANVYLLPERIVVDVQNHHSRWPMAGVDRERDRHMTWVHMDSAPVGVNRTTIIDLGKSQ
jgi:hypothetical protein